MKTLATLFRLVQGDEGLIEGLDVLRLLFWWRRHGILLSMEDEISRLRDELNQWMSRDVQERYPALRGIPFVPGSPYLPVILVDEHDRGHVNEFSVQLTRLGFPPGAILSELGADNVWGLIRPFMSCRIDEVLLVDRYLFSSGNSKHIPDLVSRITAESRDLRVLRIATPDGQYEECKGQRKEVTRSEMMEMASQWEAAKSVTIKLDIYSGKDFRERLHDRYIALRPKTPPNEDGYIAFQIGAGVLRAAEGLSQKHRTVVSRIDPEDFACIVQELARTRKIECADGPEPTAPD